MMPGARTDGKHLSTDSMRSEWKELAFLEIDVGNIAPIVFATGSDLCIFFEIETNYLDIDSS
jgi:hypothetical protein